MNTTAVQSQEVSNETFEFFSSHQEHTPSLSANDLEFIAGGMVVVNTI